MAPLVAPILRSGCRVVAFDGPGHGCSDPGALGPGRSHAAEFGKALDSVAAVHGPARAVVAHSLGAMATMLTLRFGWTSVERLVFLAPMAELRSHLDQFGQQLRLSNRARRVSMPLSRPRSGWLSRSSTSPTCWTRPRGSAAGRPRPERFSSTVGGQRPAGRTMAGRRAADHDRPGPQPAACRSCRRRPRRQLHRSGRRLRRRSSASHCTKG